MIAPSVVNPGVFYRFEPASNTASVPFLVDVSRSGREYPHDFRSPVPFSTVHDNISMYVDELYSTAPALGGTMLYACFPNTYVDTNRSAMDIDESLLDAKWPGPITKSDFTERGLGLIKRLSRYGEPMQERKLTVEEVQQRLSEFHEPYHAELSRILHDMQKKNKYTMQLSAHCMSAIGAPTHADPGKARADFNLGDCHGETCNPEAIEMVASILKDLGHTVSINFPYYGGELIRRHHQRAAGVDSVFIELNKALFIDTKTFKRTKDFSATKRSIDSLLEKITAYVKENNA